MSSPNPYAAPLSDISPGGGEWLQSDSLELTNTKRGLFIVYIGIVLVLLGLIGATVLSALELNSLQYIPGGIMALGVLLNTIGPFFCLSVPSATGAKGLIFGSVACQLLNIAVVVTALTGIMPAIKSINSVFGGLAAILFILFMRRLAVFIGRGDLASEATRTLLAAAIVVLLVVVSTIMFSIASPFGVVLMFAAGLTALVGFVMYANLLNALRKALTPGEGK